MENLEFLKNVPLFSDLTEEDLTRLCQLANTKNLSKGKTLFNEGDVGEEAFVIKEGSLEVLKASGKREILLAVREQGEVIGEFSLLQESPRSATIRARTDSILIVVNKEQFYDLINQSASAAKSLFYTILSRYKSTESMLKQSEKMAQLGTLTAGVAHELNNPAAAVKRSSNLLFDEISKMLEIQSIITGIDFSYEQSMVLNALTNHIRRRANEVIILDSLERSDKESEYEDWLENEGIENAWEIAPYLVDLNFSDEQLLQIREHFPIKLIPTILKWFSSLISVQNLTQEINRGSGRISEIVKALKTYSYLDQAPAQIIDLHEGLDTTLLILKNKLKKVKVERQYDENIPKFYAYGSELNQVWTNLIDNAIDALVENGKIVIRTGFSRNKDFVIIEIEDNGNGIPEEHQDKIFNAFFTTKAVGKGTGLGLDISYNIIVNKHLGNIKVFSKPGQTVFQIMLPLDLEHANQGQAVITQEWINFSDSKLQSILSNNDNIAVVGISDDKNETSYDIPAFLKSKGYTIFPVNPNFSGNILGEKVYSNLGEIKEKIDIALIFSENGLNDTVQSTINEVISEKIKITWMQEGLYSEDAARAAQNAGVEVVMDKCIRHTFNTLMPEFKK